MSSKELYQIRIHLIEARQLKGRDASSGFTVNPIAKLTLHAGSNALPQYSQRHEKRSAVYFDEWKFYDNIELTRKEFEDARLALAIEDDRSMFSSEPIGSVQLDLPEIYDHDGHEVFGKWFGLLAEDKGSAIQGFARISVSVLRPGDEPKSHNPGELESEDDAQMIIGLPNIETDANILTVRILGAEINPYSIPRPKVFLRVRFGTTEVRTPEYAATYKPPMYVELQVPFFTPTLSDRIRIELCDASTSDQTVVAEARLLYSTLSTDPLETQWVSMYGARPLPATNVRRLFGKDDSSAQMSDDSAYRGRLLMYAAIDPSEVPSPRVKVEQLLQAAAKELIASAGPTNTNFILRCELFEAAGIEAGPLDSIFVTLAWGDTEKKSTPRKALSGTIRFDSASHEGYYEHLDEVLQMFPSDVTQHPDVFIHVYKATPLGDQRVCYKRLTSAELLDDKKWNTPQWVMLRPDPMVRKEKLMDGAMIQIGLRLGLETEMKSGDKRKWPHVRVPKLRPFKLRANIYQAQGLQPADDNGLADPYVKVTLAGVTGMTSVVDKSLNPVWNQPISFDVLLPNDLTLAPKILVSVYDSDFTLPLVGAFGDIARGLNDPPIGAAFAPVGAGRTVRDFSVAALLPGSISSSTALPTPFWLDLYDPEKTDLAHLEDPRKRQELTAVGRLLCSFQLKTVQDETKEKRKQRRDQEKGAAAMISRGPSHGIGSLRQLAKLKYIPCFIEVSIVGVRDLQPRRVGLATSRVTSPYVEFEFGDHSAKERTWRTGVANTYTSQLVHKSGPDANILETKYLAIELPEQCLYEPILDVRVREGAKTFGIALGGNDPIIGVCSVNLGELWERHRVARAKDFEAKEVELVERTLVKVEEKQQSEQAGGADQVQRPPKPVFTNEEIVEELTFRSHAHESRGNRAAQMRRGGEPPRERGTRTRADPVLIDIIDSDDEEEEGEIAAADMELPYALEDDLHDNGIVDEVVAKAPEPVMFDLETGAAAHLVEIGSGTRRYAGRVKMAVRIIEREERDAVLKARPALKLQTLYADQLYSIRVYVYQARNLLPRPDGSPREPFLKVYNGLDVYHHRSTRNRAIGSTLEPDFYTSFELSAILPSEGQLHIEVWDYSIFGDQMIGATKIDLERRCYSRTWRTMMNDGKVPRETRKLFSPTSSMQQGSLVMRVEIVDRRLALAKPMVELSPPVREAYELRLVVWDAADVVGRDEATGTSDVFVTVQPRGASGDYEKQTTDTHMFSTGDAHYNWRMVWPVFLPEKMPRLFIQLWDWDLIGADDAIGEAQLNMKKLFDKALRRQTKTSLEKFRVEVMHPNYPGVQGCVYVSVDVVPRTEAIQFPCGKHGREAPNENPHLDPPVRPSFFDSLGIDLNVFNPFHSMKRKLMICACISLMCIILLVVIAVASGAL